MRLTWHPILLVALCLCTACAGPVHPEGTAFPTVISASAIPEAKANPPTQASSSKPNSKNDYLLSLIPKCDGIQGLEQPVSFEWPNIQQRLKELEEGYIGYFSCAQPQKEAAANLYQGIVKPPYNFTEINRVERPQGTLALYHHSGTQTWLYLWVVPNPGDEQTSLIVVAESDAGLFTPGECRLIWLKV